MKWIQAVLNVPLMQSFTYSIPENLENEVALGKRCEVFFGNRKMTAFIIEVLSELPKNLGFPAEKIKPIIRYLDKEALVTQELIELSKWISNYYICGQGEALSAMIPSGRRETEFSSGLSFEESIEKKSLTLSIEQEIAVQNILASTREDTKHVAADTNLHYLYGSTGSGKTEVFLHCAEEMLAKNKGVIYLVPEIGLTHQVIEAVTIRFGQTAAVLHSGLTPSQKLTEWNRIRNKEARVVIGARSAVFAPVPDLGLVIIDEEHDASYKSGSSPRYHARQTAIKRCAQKKIPLVMGSATPSVEAWYLMKEKRILKHTLTKRLAGGEASLIKVINMTNNTSEGCISKDLEDEIRKTKEAGRQTILFLNRRGFTHFLVCKTCGHEVTCKNCSVSLTYHKSEKKLRCHYCGWSQEIPKSCPDCGSLDISSFGFGTEFIETEIASKFPNFKVIRIDTDSISKKGELEEAIQTFKSGSADILLGTQMVAKGLNFPNVKLVGVVNADTGLHLPDFRSAERTYALIVQVAGRAGRFFPDGLVLVQTSAPQVPAIKYACESDFEGFYEQELEQREMLYFPPFSRLIRLVFRSKQEQLALQAAESAQHILGSLLKKHHPNEEVEILGPAECALSLIAGNHRWQLLLRSNKIQVMQVLCARLLSEYKTPSGIYVEIDVDPVSLL